MKITMLKDRQHMNFGCMQTGLDYDVMDVVGEALIYEGFAVEVKDQPKLEIKQHEGKKTK